MIFSYIIFFFKRKEGKQQFMLFSTRGVISLPDARDVYFNASDIRDVKLSIQDTLMCAPLCIQFYSQTTEVLQ